MDSVRGVEAAIELYKDPEYGTGRSQLGLFFFLFISGFCPSIFVLYTNLSADTVKEELAERSFSRMDFVRSALTEIFL